jgi:murein L,D-transpeptidase YcbB/YkuD
MIYICLNFFKGEYFSGVKQVAMIIVYLLPCMTFGQADTFDVQVPRLSYYGLTEINNYRENSQTSYEIKDPLYQSLRSISLALYDSVVIKPKLYSRKLKGAQIALTTFIWMYDIVKENEFTIVVNIPSATLLLFRYDTPVFESKVIVGKRSTRTPTIASLLTDITIYPYWLVPKSIATKELLPEIKKDLSYLERNNFQVLDKKGAIADPKTIPWDALGPENFPYTIRQSTGCDNSLGLIKLNINNPFNVYLHDTPWKILFESSNRFYSHGCVRVEKAKELAHILLKENSVAVDTLDEKASLLGHKPTVLKLTSKIPVLILYNTAWFDMKGHVGFYADIYSKLE